MDLQGVVPVIPTCFHPDETIDEASVRKTVDFAIAKRASAICAPAFGSEFYKLSEPERRQIAGIVVDQAAGRVPVIISTGSGSIYTTVEFSRHAESIGAQAVMVSAPQVVPVGLEGLITFYEQVCRSVSIPVILQDYSTSGGSGVPTELLIELAERCNNLLYAKLENPLSGGKCLEIIHQSGGKVRVLYGMGGIALFDGLAHGACGVMPGPALTDVYVRIFQLWEQGLLDDAKALFYRLQPFLTFGFQHLELFILLEKRVLVRRGIISSDRLREPTLHLDEQYEKQISDLIEAVMRLIHDVQVSRVPA